MQRISHAQQSELPPPPPSPSPPPAPRCQRVQEFIDWRLQSFMYFWVYFIFLVYFWVWFFSVFLLNPYRTRHERIAPWNDQTVSTVSSHFEWPPSLSLSLSEVPTLCHILCPYLFWYACNTRCSFYPFVALASVSFLYIINRYICQIHAPVPRRLCRCLPTLPSLSLFLTDSLCWLLPHT